MELAGEPTLKTEKIINGKKCSTYSAFPVQIIFLCNLIKFLLIEKLKPINEEEKIHLENHHFCKPNEIMDINIKIINGC